MNLQRIEVLDLGGDLAGEGGGVEAGDRSTPLLPASSACHTVVGIVADAADESDPGYDDAPAQATSILSRAR